MERGEDWEHEAVCDRRALMTHRRRVTRRLVGAFVLGLTATVLSLLAVAPGACARSRGMYVGCDPLTTGHEYTALVVVAVAVLGVGLWLGASALRIELGYRGRRN